MNNRKHSEFDIDDAKQGRLLEFIRRVSPDSDPKTALLFAQLSHANRQLVQAVEKRLAGAGLSWMKFRILLDLLRNENLGTNEGLQPSELSELESIPRNSMSGLIVSLEEGGMVRRELHPTDRRKFVIRLSPKGRKLLKAELDSQFKFLTGCFSTFTPGERDELFGLLRRLNTSLAEKEKQIIR